MLYEHGKFVFIVRINSMEDLEKMLRFTAMPCWNSLNSIEMSSTGESSEGAN